MSRVLSESQLALLRRQFISEALGESLSEDTANALLNAAEANNKAVAALEEAETALAEASAAVSPGELDAALVGYATEEHVANAVTGLASEEYVTNAVDGLASEAYVDGKFTAGANFASGSLTGKLVTIVDGLITEVVDE